MQSKYLKIIQHPFSFFCVATKLNQRESRNFSPFPPNTNPCGYSVGLQGGEG